VSRPPRLAALLTARDWEARPAGRWEDGERSVQQIGRAQPDAGSRRPPDLVVRATAACSWDRAAISLFWVDELPDRRLGLQWLPGMIVIGDDGGGGLYFYDPSDRLGRGRWALYWVHMSEMSLERPRFAGSDLTDLLHRIANGVSFFYEPRVR
jgi:hypothetical protein